jgi:glycosyltransferase involved in cell wall biosynthesis
MRLFILANSNSTHTIKWVNSLAQRGNMIYLYSLEKTNDVKYYVNANIILIDAAYPLNNFDRSILKIFKIASNFLQVRKHLKQINPDILHAYYATSYGLLGALCFFKPFLISVWGSDIFDFPNKSMIHKSVLKFNLNSADKILSTSHIMAQETQTYCDKVILVTPFGVDLEKFKMINCSKFIENSIVIGTVKTLSSNYGIDYLIKAYKIVKDAHTCLPLKLLIVGDGEDRAKLEALCKKLNIFEDVIFTGQVENEQVPYFLNMLDIYVALSVSESFGVAIIEASACEKPVVVSRVGGLPEVVENEITGFVVESRNASAAASAIERLVLDKDLRADMGKLGRQRVTELYNWEENLDLMINILETSVID